MKAIPGGKSAEAPISRLAAFRRVEALLDLTAAHIHPTTQVISVENSEAPFTIPESAHGPLRDLVDMKADDFDAFMSGLKTAAPSISTVSLSRHIARSAPQIPRSVVNAVVSEIMTLEYLKQESEMLPEEFGEALADSALESTSEDFPFLETDAKVLKERIAQIFSSDQVLRLNTKAISILTDHDNLFLSAKILTDARPVFNEDVTKMEAIAIVHMLRIHFERNQEHKDFFVALDVADIPKMRAVLDRADKKAALLQNALKATKVAYLDIEPPEDDR